MLLGFSVENFKSFNERQTISFVANKGSRLKSHIYISDAHKTLKSTLIYGANAGGKSNLIKAIAFSKGIILNGLIVTPVAGNYFKVERDAYKRPAVFEYRILTGEKEYSYGIVISYENQEVISEWLDRIDNDRRSFSIFNRDNENGNYICLTDVRDKSEESKRFRYYLEDFQEHISDDFKKKTVLSDVATRANGRDGIFSEISAVYKWFNDIIILFPDSKFNSLGELATEVGGRQLLTKYITKFDTGIENIDSRKNEISIEKLLADLPTTVSDQLKLDLAKNTNNRPIWVINGQLVRVSRSEEGNLVYKKLVLNHGNDDELFEYEEESDGTKRIFDLIPLLYTNFDNRVVLIDEIDRSLHTCLTRKFMEYYYEVAMNKKCQLIATTHDSNLMDLDLVRQDEIWFVDRDKNHSSKLYPLDKFKVRYDKKIDKEYINGRYDAVPALNDRWCED